MTALMSIDVALRTTWTSYFREQRSPEIQSHVTWRAVLDFSGLTQPILSWEPRIEVA